MWNPFSKSKKTKVRGFAEQDNNGQWFQYFQQYMNSLNGENVKYSNELAYELACNVAEIFIPIDAIADRSASIEYKIRNKRTKEDYEPQGNLARLLEQPNPLQRMSDIVYQSVFSEFSDGNSYIYTKTPDSIKNPTIDNISNIWVLKPNVTKPILLKEISNPFLMKDKKDFIKEYKTHFLINYSIEPRYILHRTLLEINEQGKSVSPLSRVQRNINNILAVYQARFNVYDKNGNAGILSKAPSNMNNLQEAVDPITRDEMLADIQNRNGITGNKNFTAISSIPLQFIKTLGTIAELQPFEETESNAVTIAGAFGVDAELIPRKGSSTFTNKNDAEKSLWQNVIKSVCEDKAKDLTKVFYLPEDLEFYPDFSKVECLQEDKKTALESDALLIANVASLTEQNQDMSQALSNLKDKYNEY